MAINRMVISLFGLILCILAVFPGISRAQDAGDNRLPDLSAGMPVEVDELIDYLAIGYTHAGTELALDEAIALALEHNHGINSARLNAAAACKGVDVAWADLNPQVGLQAKGYYQASNYHAAPVEPAAADGGSIPFGASDESGNDLHRSLAVSVTQRLWDFGLSRDLIDLEKAKHGIEVQVVNQSEQELVTDVIKAYYGYNLALGQARVRQNELRLAEELHRQAEIQYRTGVVPQLDVVRALTRMEDARSSSITAQATVGDSAAYFHSLLGLEDQRYVPAPLTVPLLETGPAPVEVNAAIATALETRPELRMQQSILVTGELGKSLTQSRPVINAYGNAMYAVPAGMGGTDNYEYGIQLSWNLYTGGKDKAAGEQAELSLASINEDIVHLEAMVELDATTAWNAVMAARSRTASAARSLELANEAYRAASVGYTAGVTTYTDYLNAMDTQVAAAIGHRTALADVKLAQADFARALGYPTGYPGDSRADGDGSASALTALGLIETDTTEQMNPGAK